MIFWLCEAHSRAGDLKSGELTGAIKLPAPQLETINPSVVASEGRVMSVSSVPLVRHTQAWNSQ